MQLAIYNADPHRIIERHTHEDAHFVLVLGGRYVSSAREFTAGRPDRILIYNPPGTSHRDQFSADGDVFVGRFFTVSVPSTLDVDGSGRGMQEGVARRMSHPIAVAAALRLVRECIEWDSVSSFAAEALGLELLDRVHGTPVCRERHAPPWLSRCIEQLFDAGSHVTNVGALAREAGVHPVHLARTFRDLLGESPGALLRRRRVARAIALIRGTSRALAAIALECGFTDQSHMSRSIRRASGGSPSTLRATTSGVSCAESSRRPSRRDTRTTP